MTETENQPKKLQEGDIIEVREGEGFAARKIVKIFQKRSNEDEASFIQRVKEGADLTKQSLIPGEDLADNVRYRDKSDLNAIYIVESEEK